MVKKLKLKLVAKYLEYERKKLINLIPTHLQSQFEKEAYIAGGSIWSLYNWKKVNDYDFFIETNKLARELVFYFKTLEGVRAKLEYGKFIHIGKYKNQRLVITENAITIGKYQIILKDIGKPKDVLSKFDFKHNMHYLKDGYIFTASDTYNLELNQLIFNDRRARDIASCAMRIPKFLNKGMTISTGELRKILLDIHEKGMSEDEINLLKNNKNIHFGSGS